MDYLKNYVWLIGGSIMSEPMCQEIKKRGYNLLLTDGDKNCHCRKYTDEFKAISVYDEFNHMALGRLQRENPKGILCIGCDAGPTVSLLTDYFELPGIPYHVARQVKHKGKMRQSLNFTHPEFYFDGIPEHKSDKRYLLKPTDQAGSRGIEFFNLDKHKHIEDNQYVIEEYCEGKDLFPEIEQFDTSEIALDCLIYNSELIYLNGALRLFWRDMMGIEAGHINPYVPDQDVMKIVSKAAERLEVDYGIFKIDLKCTRDYGWIVLECATRPSGGFDHGFTSPLATGKNITGIILDSALGLEFDPSKNENVRNRFACAYAPKFEVGKVKDYATATPDRVTHFFNLMKDNEIKELDCNQNRPFFVICPGENELGAMGNALEAGNLIEVIYE